MSRARVVIGDLKDEKSSKGFLIRHGHLVDLFETGCNKKVSDITFVKGRFKEYDGTVEFEDGTTATFEMKEDKSCRRTGNICVEYFGRSGASGINATTADYWLELIHSFDEQDHLKLTLSDTKKVKKFVDDAAKKERSLNWFRSITGGDNNSAYSYLVKEDKFMDNVVDIFVLVNRNTYMKETGVGEFGAVVAQKRGW